MPESPPKPPMTSLQRWPIADAAERAERKALRLKRRKTELDNLVTSAKLDAARLVALRRHAFKDDDDPDFTNLTKQQQRLVRQWEQPKRMAAFAVESAARLIDSVARSEQEKPGVQINVENARIILPEKREETVAPVVIDVAAENE